MEKKRKQRLKLIHGTMITGIGTLFSRLLGMIRDSVTAAMLGMSSGGVMDAFVLAFRVPDIARRMFGEGSLSVGFIPVFSRLWSEDRQKAWKLLTVAMSRMFLLLSGFVILGELACLACFRLLSEQSRWYFVAHLASLMLPYLILICMTALSAAALQTFGRFAVVSAVPMILNIVWLFGLLVLAPMISDDPMMRCYLLTICVLFAGLLQFLILLPFLRKFGAVFDYDVPAVRPEIRSISATFFPQMFGLMSIQINVLVATAFAWLLSGDPGESVRWLGSFVHYPMLPGATSAIYFSERLYEFPQGMLGLAVAAAIYPMLGKHAAKKDVKAISEDLCFGIRLVVSLAIPAGVGLAILSENLSHLLYQRHSFTEQDMYRTADMIFWFSGGVWGFCAIPILVRGFYVMNDMKTPLRIGFCCSVFHAFLCAILIWPMAEQGLALSAGLAAGIQTIILLIAFTLIHSSIGIGKIIIAVARAGIASLIMGISIQLALDAVPGSDSFADLLHIFIALAIGLPVFAACYWMLGGRTKISLSIHPRSAPVKKKKKRKKRDDDTKEP